MNRGIRPGVWIAASATLIAAAAIVRLAVWGEGGESHRQPTRTVSLDRSKARSGDEAVGVHPTAALLPSSSRPASERADAPKSAAQEQPRERSRLVSERLQPADSRAAADLRILEEEAARRAESLGLVSVAGRATSGGAAVEEERRVALADAVLIEHLVQDAYRGTEFPLGFPAEERTRAAATSEVRALTPELRQGMLEVALQEVAEQRVGPRFDSYQIWEGMLH